MLRVFTDNTTHISVIPYLAHDCCGITTAQVFDVAHAKWNIAIVYILYDITM